MGLRFGLSVAPPFGLECLKTLAGLHPSVGSEGAHRSAGPRPPLKPDVQFSRIRLSDKVSCVRTREVAGLHLELDEPQRVVNMPEVGPRRRPPVSMRPPAR